MTPTDIPSLEKRKELAREPTQSNETFCIYCQKQYQSPQNLKRHVLLNHPGTYRYWAYIYEEEE